MTNADCIRRMSDDQLYDFLSDWECGDIDYSITFCDLCKQGGNELNLDCDGCRKHWLQRDAVDVGGLMYWKRNTAFTAFIADTPQTDCDKCIWNVCNYNRVDWDADTPQTLPKDIVQPCGNGNVMMSEDTYEELLQTDCPWK